MTDSPYLFHLPTDFWCWLFRGVKRTRQDNSGFSCPDGGLPPVLSCSCHDHSAQILEFFDWLVLGVLAGRFSVGKGKSGSIYSRTRIGCTQLAGPSEWLFASRKSHLADLSPGHVNSGSALNLSGHCSCAAAEGSLPPPFSLATMNVSQKIPTSQCVIQ